MVDRVVAFFTRWKPNVTKVSLQMASKRAQMMRNKGIMQQRKAEEDIAQCLSQGREEKARIKCEHLIHLRNMEMAYDIVETLCELIQTRISHLSESNECPSDLVTPLASIIYASHRLQIPELHDSVKQLNAKFGVSFTTRHSDNLSGSVSPNLVSK